MDNTYILIPSFGDFGRLTKCIQSIRNNVAEKNVRMVIEYGEDMLGHAEGFTVTANRLLVHALENKADSVFLVSDDTQVVTPGFLNIIHEYAEEHPDVGAITPMELLEGKPFSLMPHSGETRQLTETEPEEIVYPMFAFVWIRGAALKGTGILDEDFNPGYYDDYDYGIRLWQTGWRCVWLPTVKFKHERGVTMNKYHAGGVGNNAAKFQAKHRWTYAGMDTRKTIEKLKQWNRYKPVMIGNQDWVKDTWTGEIIRREDIPK